MIRIPKTLAPYNNPVTILLLFLKNAASPYIRQTVPYKKRPPDIKNRIMYDSAKG